MDRIFSGGILCGFDYHSLVFDMMYWYCPNCDHVNHSRTESSRFTCANCGQKFVWDDIEAYVKEYVEDNGHEED